MRFTTSYHTQFPQYVRARFPIPIAVTYWALRRFHASPDFTWEARRADDWRTPWLGWTPTRYEAKARAAGRASAYLTFRRR